MRLQLPPRAYSINLYSLIQATNHSSYSQIHLLSHSWNAFLQRNFPTPFHVCLTLKLLSSAMEEHGAPVRSPSTWTPPQDCSKVPYSPCPRLPLIDSHRPCNIEDSSRYPTKKPGCHPKCLLLISCHIQLSPSPHNCFSWSYCVTVLGPHSHRHLNWPRVTFLYC